MGSPSAPPTNPGSYRWVVGEPMNLWAFKLQTLDPKLYWVAVKELKLNLS